MSNPIAMAAARSFSGSNVGVNNLAHMFSSPQQKPAQRSATPKPLSSTSAPSQESRAESSSIASPAPGVTSPAVGNSKIKGMANMFAAKAEQNAAPIRTRAVTSPSPVKQNPASSASSVRSPTGGLSSKSTTGAPPANPPNKDSNPIESIQIQSELSLFIFYILYTSKSLYIYIYIFLLCIFLPGTEPFLYFFSFLIIFDLSSESNNSAPREVTGEQNW
jgi:hypothetical protein